MPARQEMPRTIKRSPPKAQRTWAKAHDHAVESYGEGERAHRTAYAALKHSFEKVGDRWTPKKAKGPSDPRAAKPREQARRGKGETFGGVDYAGRSKDELVGRAKRLGVRGASRMDKKEVARAIARKQKSAGRRRAA
ncbi:MAG: ChaB family protein [Candidatus Rokuibacteriota bacterium]